MSTTPPPAAVQDVLDYIRRHAGKDAFWRCHTAEGDEPNGALRRRLEALAPTAVAPISRHEAALREALGRIDLKAEAGLCYFTLESAREFLKDIRVIARAAIAASPPAATEEIVKQIDKILSQHNGPELELMQALDTLASGWRMRLQELQDDEVLPNEHRPTP